MVWRPPELPPMQKMPRERKPKPPSKLARLLGGIAGVAFLVTSVVSLIRALQDTSGKSSPVMALAILMPAVILIRYALTGQIKMN